MLLSCSVIFTVHLDRIFTFRHAVWIFETLHSSLASFAIVMLSWVLIVCVGKPENPVPESNGKFLRHSVGAASETKVL